MAKQNAMLARLEAAAEAKYARLFHDKVSMLLQRGQDAAMIAANETLQMGAGRARDFGQAYITTMNQMAHMATEDQKDDPEFVWTKAKIDDRIRSIVGEENFRPWEIRYGEKEDTTT
jgi:hypothetical protein